MIDFPLGFVGVGMMGGPMAARLLDAGVRLAIYDTSEAALGPLMAKGATRCASPAEVASAADIVLVSLPTPKVVREVALGGNGVIAGERANVFVDLSTTGPRVAVEVAQALAFKGITAVDAPVSGGPTGANSGRLAIWVGGDRTVFDKYKPVLDAMGDAARYIGPIGAGSIAKLVHNAAGAAVSTVLAEVFTMGVKVGVDPLPLWEAIC